MLKTETKQLLDSIAILDNRKVTPEVIEAWHSVIGGIPFDIAQEALTLAQRDPNVKYLEPRHIYAWSKEAAFRLDKKKPVEQEVKRGAPEPICKAHNLKITQCRPCCKKMSTMEHLTSAQLLLWAKQEIYA